MEEVTTDRGGEEVVIYLWLSEFYGSVWIELIFAETENWKHRSKIIFKCVNSVMEPMNNAWTVFLVPCIVKSCDITVHAHGKKKSENAKRKHHIQLNPNRYNIVVAFEEFGLMEIHMIELEIG